MWEQESEEFRSEFQARIDAEYKESMETFLNRHQTPSTPEEYHRHVVIDLFLELRADVHMSRAYQSMPTVINMFIEGMCQSLGVAMTVVMVGPVPSQGGRIAINRFVVSLGSIYAD